MRCLIFAKAIRILGFYKGVIMKKKQLKKIKKIIGMLSAIVQEHEVRNMLKHSVIRPYEEVDTKSDKPAFAGMYERMVWEIENKSSDKLRAELEEGKALGEKISTEYQKLLKDWEEAGTCPMARQRVGDEMMEAMKATYACAFHPRTR
jgi:hypothetical protein